jgi:hypothetical protein
MFLLRCLFWLGLVFFQIAQREGADPSATMNPAVASQTARLGQMAAKAAARQCEARPDACVALAGAAAKINLSAPSRDTLTRRDRTTAWRESD